MRRLAVDGAAFLQEHLPDLADGFRQQIAPLIFRSKEDKVDKAFAPTFATNSGRLTGSSRSMCLCTISFISQCRQSVSLSGTRLSPSKFRNDASWGRVPNLSRNGCRSLRFKLTPHNARTFLPWYSRTPPLRTKRAPTRGVARCAGEVRCHD
jgi:hypothetical protein